MVNPSPYPGHGRLAQLARAPRLHRGGRGFEPLSAHHEKTIPFGVVFSCLERRLKAHYYMLFCFILKLMDHDQYFEAARRVATGALCHRARCGSVVVSKEGDIIGKGYNAPPLEDESQRMCMQNEFNMAVKPKSDKTCCVHAEWNAIIDALKNNSDQVEGATLYFMRVDETGGKTEAGKPYCTVCSRLALQSGIKSFGLWNEGPQMFDTKNYNKLSYDFYL